jgi:hypothetical protein
MQKGNLAEAELMESWEIRVARTNQEFSATAFELQPGLWILN